MVETQLALRWHENEHRTDLEVNSLPADDVLRKVTYSSNQFEHLIPVDIVHSDDGVECSIAHGVVTVSYVNCYFL